MREVLRLVAALAEFGASRYGSSQARRIVGAAIRALLAAAFAIAAGGFLMAAAWIYLAPLIGRGATALVIAAIFAVTSLLLLLVRRRRTNPPPVLDAATLERDWQAISKETKDLVKNHKGLLVLAAFIAGLLASNGARGKRR